MASADASDADAPDSSAPDAVSAASVSAADRPDRRVAGVDAIRFLSAAVVALWHLGFPPVLALSPSPDVQKLHPWTSFFGIGSAGVMVFFLISGFCIHFPYRNHTQIDVRSFLARRVIRLGLPLALWLGFSRLFVHEWYFTTGVLWSLWAELIYYALYPALLIARRKWGWRLVQGVAYVAAIVIVAKYNREWVNNYSLATAWIVGLPVWLLGVRLAERFDTRPVPSLTQIWCFRLLNLGAAAIAFILHWKGISEGWMMNVYAVAAFFWIDAEIAWRRVHRPWRWLEAAGAWSYSYYLVHNAIGHRAAALLKLGDTRYSLDSNLVAHASALLFAYLLYRLAEKPAHTLARKIGSRLSR